MTWEQRAVKRIPVDSPISETMNSKCRGKTKDIYGTTHKIRLGLFIMWNTLRLRSRGHHEIKRTDDWHLIHVASIRHIQQPEETGMERSCAFLHYLSCRYPPFRGVIRELPVRPEHLQPFTRDLLPYLVS